MDVSSFLAPSSIRCAVSARSKKHSLEILSQLLAEASGNACARDVLDGLIARERLGSTSLDSSSIAMPHTRLAAIKTPVCAVLKLTAPIDFAASNGVPVDLLFGLLVPAESTPAELESFRGLVVKLGDRSLAGELRDCSEPGLLYRLFADSLTAGGAAPAANEASYCAPDHHQWSVGLR